MTPSTEIMLLSPEDTAEENTAMMYRLGRIDLFDPSCNEDLSIK
jgi:hypothetical protein